MEPIVIEIHNRGDLARFLQNVEHAFEPGEAGTITLNTSAYFGEGTDDAGKEVELEFTVVLDASPIAPIAPGDDDAAPVEPTPQNRVFLMSRAFNSVLEQFEVSIIRGDVTEYGGQPIKLTYLDDTVE